MERPTRIACIREIQSSLKDSVYQLIKDKIQSLGVGSRFQVMDTEIRGANGSLIIFKGMQSFNAETIKSLEGYDIAWVEEAQTLSHKSLQLLRPTIRKDGSELWYSWNPRFRTDPVDMLFRKNPPPDAVSVLTNWKDNPWFPEVLRREMEHDFGVDEEDAEHVWNGAYQVSQGAILARQVDRAEREGRINDNVEYDPEGPGIEISSDIGFRDTAAWWFWQRRVGGAVLLDYMEDAGLDAQEWLPMLQERLAGHGWPLAKIWLPHDAKTKTFQSDHTVIEQFLGAFGPGKVSIVPRVSKLDRINAARTMTRRVEFHKTNCALGLDGLRAWTYKYNDETQTYSREPDHNWASHPSDAYSYGCQMIGGIPNHTDAEVIYLGPRPDSVLTGCTLNDLWDDEEERKKRWAHQWV